MGESGVHPVPGHGLGGAVPGGATVPARYELVPTAGAVSVDVEEHTVVAGGGIGAEPVAHIHGQHDKSVDRLRQRPGQRAAQP